MTMKTKKLLLGDEAFAQGAIDAGLSGTYAYPGTPSTEITEYIQMHTSPTGENKVHSRWSTNEKTAYEEAIGMSFCGKRAIVCMKHVGLNVAADPFVNSGMTGAHGGMLLAVADDPSMHSSQNEQDSRFYADFALIPCLEPSNQQEAYDMAAYGFDLSERHQIPVMTRFVTRLSHSRGTVEVSEEKRAQNELSYPEDKRRWVLMPVNSKVRYRQLLAQQKDFVKESENSPFNKLIDAADHSLGIITSGIAYNYLMELFPEGCPWPVLKISQYPLPEKQVRELVENTDAVLVIEEGQSLIEKRLRGTLDRGGKVYGKLSGELPADGELNPEVVREAIKAVKGDVVATPELNAVSQVTVPRPPALCKGCGHRDVYNALNAVLKEYESPKVFGDIGCYTLGWLSPFHALDTCLDMGASITMAKGAADAGQHPSVAIIGDSTFTHSGMTGLLDAINENTPMTVIISDNLTTGMTGGQDSQGTGKLEDICRGLGADPAHVRTIDSMPTHIDDMKALFKEEIDYPGLSVIVSRRECIQTARRHATKK